MISSYKRSILGDGSLVLFASNNRQCQQKPPELEYGGRQIVSRPIFSDSPYEYRVLANFLALENQF
jgi:hypothetical protein